MKVKILKSCSFSLDGIKTVSFKKGETVDIINLDDVRKLVRHGVATKDLEAEIIDEENTITPLTDEQLALVYELCISEDDFRSLSEEEIEELKSSLLHDDETLINDGSTTDVDNLENEEPIIEEVPVFEEEIIDDDKSTKVNGSKKGGKKK